MRAKIALMMVVLSWPLTAHSADRLDKGEVVITTRAIKGSEIAEATVKAVVNAPLERVWAVIKNCNKYVGVLPRVKESKQIKRSGSAVICRVVIDMPWPLDDLAATTKAIHVERPGKLFSRTWSLLKGDYRVNRGSWKLTPYKGAPGRTMVVYVSHADPKISVPKWIQSAARKRALPKLIQALRKHSGAKR